MTVHVPLGPLLRAFFANHLLQQKAVSPQTINAYRDAFRLLLTFLDQHRQRKPEALTLDDLDAPVILAARGRSLFAEPRCSGNLAMSD